MSSGGWQLVLSGLALLCSAVVGVVSAMRSSGAQRHTAEVNAAVQAEANETEAGRVVVSGALELTAGLRTELNAVKIDLAAERQAARELRERLVARIDALERQHDEDRQRMEHLESDNRRLQRELAELQQTQRRPRSARTRDGDTGKA